MDVQNNGSTSMRIQAPRQAEPEGSGSGMVGLFALGGLMVAGMAFMAFEGKIKAVPGKITVEPLRPDIVRATVDGVEQITVKSKPSRFGSGATKAVIGGAVLLGFGCLIGGLAYSASK